MRRGVGVAGLMNKLQQQKQLSKQGADLESVQINAMREQLVSRAPTAEAGGQGFFFFALFGAQLAPLAVLV